MDTREKDGRIPPVNLTIFPQPGEVRNKLTSRYQARHETGWAAGDL